MNLHQDFNSQNTCTPIKLGPALVDNCNRRSAGKSVCAVLRAVLFLAILTVAPFANGAPADLLESTNKSAYLPWEKGSVTFGGFLAAFSSDLGFGVNNTAGITINAEEVFGLQTSLTVWRGGLMYRPGESRRNQIDVIYARYHRNGNANLSEDINIGGSTYPAGTHVESVFNFDILRSTYSYALLQDERMRIALGVGVYVVPLKYNLTLGNSGSQEEISGADTTLPLPEVALRSEFQLVPKLFLNASIDAMYLEIDHFQGSLLDVNVGLEYRPWEHWGFGLGYNGMSVSVRSEDSSSYYPGANFVGAVDVRYAGLMAYVTWSF